MGMAEAPVQSKAPNSKWLLRFCAHMHSRVVAHAHICGAHFDIESGISQLLDGPRSCPLEGAVCGYGAGTCAKHSSQLQADFEIFELTCKIVWRHTHVCRHTILHVRTKISKSAWSWELCFAQVPAPDPHTAPSNGQLLGPSRS